jgi:hypothetical protein
MASTYVNDLRLNEMATGDGSGTWGTTTNTNLELIGEALGYGTEAITTNADTHTSTIADGATDPVRAMYVKYTGTLDSACTITIAPNTVNRMHFIENGTSGSQNIIISQGSGANVTIPAGDTKAVYLDGAGSGAAVVDAFASLSVVDLKVQDDLTVTDDATIGGTLGVTGIVTLTDDLIIGDGKTIGSASDVDAMTIAANGQITLTQTLIGTALDISGDIDVDGTTNLDNTDIDGTLDVSGQATFADGSAGAPSISNTGDVNAGLFFSAADVMSFSAGGTAQFTMADGSISPVTDNDIDLGTASLKYKSFFAGLVDSENFKVNGGQGSDGQVLTSTGSGVAWEDAAGGGPTFKAFGTNSIMVGDNATGTIDAANQNTALGLDVFAALTSADDNTAIGFETLQAATTGHSNTAVGSQALKSLVDDSHQVAVGFQALMNETVSGSNVAVGSLALTTSDGGSNNVAVGKQALTSSTTADHNVAVGSNALAAITDGHSNVAVGYLAASTLATGATYQTRNNVAIGREALENQATQEDNIAIGYQAMHSGNSPSNSQNTIVGSQAFPDSGMAGYGNTGLGYSTGQSVTTGLHNTLIGRQAGNNITTGDENINMGYLARPSAASGTGQVVIAHNLAGKGNNTGLFGGASGVYNEGNTTAWQTTSDERIKKNITDNNIGLDAINKIKIRNFEYRTEDEVTELPKESAIKKEGNQVGVIAQEIQKILPDVVQEQTTGCLSVNSDNLTWYLINAVQELSAEIKELKGE